MKLNTFRSFASVILAMVFMCFLSACDNVQSGYVGVKVNKYGDDRGVQNEVLGPGRYYTGLNTDIVEFPTFIQTVIWTKNPNEGKPVDESITFQSKEGTVINADFG